MLDVWSKRAYASMAASSHATPAAAVKGGAAIECKATGQGKDRTKLKQATWRPEAKRRGLMSVVADPHAMGESWLLDSQVHRLP